MPKLGDIVLFHDGNRLLPAIVVNVNDNDPDKVDLSAFPPAGSSHGPVVQRRNVGRDDDGGGMTWRPRS